VTVSQAQENRNLGNGRTGMPILLQSINTYLLRTQEHVTISVGDMIGFDKSCDNYADLYRTQPISGRCYYVDSMFLGVVKQIEQVPYGLKFTVDVVGTISTSWGRIRRNQITEVNRIRKYWPKD